MPGRAARLALLAALVLALACAAWTADATGAVARTSAAARSWALARPHGPVRAIVNPRTLGLNVNDQAGGSYHDVRIDGGGDSSILLQGSTHGVTLARIAITRTDARPAVAWDAHAIYVKARGNTFRDISADNGGGHGVSGLSVRMGGNVFERTVLRGYAHAFTYYEHDGAAGTVRVTDAEWWFTGDTAIWGDDSNEPPRPFIKQRFVFENVDAHGPPGAAFLRFGRSVYAGGLAYRGAGVTIRHCTINGRPVTAADVTGVPARLLHVVG